VVVESTKIVPTHEIKKTVVRINHPGRTALPAHLRRVEIVLEPSEDVSMLQPIGQEITEILAYQQAELFVKKYIRNEYLQPSADGLHAKRIIAQVPNMPIAKSYVSASLLAQLLVGKYVDHLPIYRQLQIFTRQKVTIPESTVVNWIREGCKLLHPLFTLYEKQLLATNYLNVDETTIKVLDKSKKGTTHTGYYWVFFNTLDKTVLFKYNESRSGVCPRETLQSYQGYLHADGYGVYEDFEKVPGITVLNCWAHARRKFYDAQSFDKTNCETILTEIQKLYTIEKHCKDEKLTVEQITTYRQTNAKPILDAMHTLLQSMLSSTTPKSPLGMALQYTLKRWDKLNTYTTDGNLTIDNNLVENSIRPIAIGRKNYLFAGSHQAAHNSAMIYSFFATCKLYNANPIEWLNYVLDNINDCKMNNLEDLLPQNYNKIAK
jgi:transposase